MDSIGGSYRGASGRPCVEVYGWCWSSNVERLSMAVLGTGQHVDIVRKGNRATHLDVFARKVVSSDTSELVRFMSVPWIRSRSRPSRPKENPPRELQVDRAHFSLHVPFARLFSQTPTAMPPAPRWLLRHARLHHPPCASQTRQFSISSLRSAPLKIPMRQPKMPVQKSLKLQNAERIRRGDMPDDHGFLEGTYVCPSPSASLADSVRLTPELPQGPSSCPPARISRPWCACRRSGSDSNGSG